MPHYLKLHASHQNFISAEAGFMQAFGVLWDAGKNRQHAEGMGIFASRRMGLAWFHDASMYTQTSFPRLVACGRGLKTIPLLLFFTWIVLPCSSNWGSDPSVSQLGNNGQQCHREFAAYVTTPGLPKSPSMSSVTPLTMALRSHCHPAGAKTRHSTCTQVYSVDRHGAVVWLWFNSHSRGSSACASARYFSLRHQWGTSSFVPCCCSDPCAPGGEAWYRK